MSKEKIYYYDLVKFIQIELSLALLNRDWKRVEKLKRRIDMEVGI